VLEFIVIVESSADARTATKLAERVLTEQIDWLDDDSVQYYFQWTGLLEGTEYSCWKDIDKIVASLKSSGLRFPRYLGHPIKGVPLKADGAASIKVLNLVRFLQRTRQIRSVIFIRDLDNQPERREGLEQARSQHINQEPKLEIVIGAADPKREAWVLNGFIPSNQQEEQILEQIKSELTFDPCIESHRLRSNSQEEPDRIRNPKVVVGQLTSEDIERERQCWEDTSLQLLRERGVNTGLKDYMCEVKERLSSIISSE
jgi:hypothetical protein